MGGGNTGYWLLDNPNPNGPHYYTSRRKPLRQIVIHITASVEDQDMRGGDESAEQTARYAATTERQVSWHVGADSDSWVPLLPPGYTAWHASDYNSSTYGVEISKRDTTWRNEPPAWVEATLSNAAAACRPIVERYGIPLRRLTRAQVDAGEKGFVYHSDLDPSRRFDPGDDFPIRRFFELIKEDDDMPTAEDLWREPLVRWPRDDDDPQKMSAGQQLNQARGWSVIGVNQNRRILRAVRAIPNVVRANAVDAAELAEQLQPYLSELVGTTVEDSVEVALSRWDGRDHQELVTLLIAELGNQLAGAEEEGST